MSDLKQYLIDEFVDDYMEARMNRRDVLKRIAGITGSMTAAVAILAACGPAPVAILEAPPYKRTRSYSHIRARADFRSYV